MITNRSQEKEWLDLGPSYYSPRQYDDCQKQLFTINRFLRIFSNTVNLLQKMPTQSALLDVGCGGGLFLLHLSTHFPEMKLLGTDISSEAISFANRELQKWQMCRGKNFNHPNNSICFNHPNPSNHNINVTFHLAETPDKLAVYDVDIILLNLVCHHLLDQELILYLQHLRSVAKNVIIINDLHRHFIPYWFYASLSPILFRNRMITHDGLISIRRGFTRSDWETILAHAGITHYQLNWRFPFCWQVILWNQ